MFAMANGKEGVMAGALAQLPLMEGPDKYYV